MGAKKLKQIHKRFVKSSNELEGSGLKEDFLKKAYTMFFNTFFHDSPVKDVANKFLNGKGIEKYEKRDIGSGISGGRGPRQFDLGHDRPQHQAKAALCYRRRVFVAAGRRPGDGAAAAAAESIEIAARDAGGVDDRVVHESAGVSRRQPGAAAGIGADADFSAVCAQHDLRLLRRNARQTADHGALWPVRAAGTGR